jgi:hypothetical protein
MNLPMRSFWICIPLYIKKLVVVGLSVVERSLETLKKYFEQKPNDALSHIRSIQGLHKEISSHHLEASRQTTIYRIFLSVSLIGRISSTYYYIDYFFQSIIFY